MKQNNLITFAITRSIMTVLILYTKQEKEAGTNFVLFYRSRNMIGRFMETYLHKPIKILQLLTRKIIQ